MPTQKFWPTTQQKRDALFDVCYEIEQFLESSTLGTNNIVVNNALVESRLLHLRVLIDFFNLTQRSVRRVKENTIEQDDVLAKDFGFTTHKVQIDPSFVDRLNKDLAHLTYSRSQRRSELAKRWPMKSTISPVLVVVQAFIDHLLASNEYTFDQPTADYLKALLRKVADLQTGASQLPDGA